LPSSPAAVAVIKVRCRDRNRNEGKEGARSKTHCTQPRAAVEEGVVPGGGVALVRALKAIEKLVGNNEDQTTGHQDPGPARSKSPLRQIVANCRRKMRRWF